MSCGVNIPLSSVVEAMFDEYGETIVKHILDKINADKDICDRDNHVVDFSIDKANDRIIISLKFGEKFSISKKELVDWIGVIPSVGGNSPYIVSGVFVSRDGGYWLDFTRNDDTKVNVDMTAIINELVDTLRTQILGMGYTLKTENNHYTTQAEDFNGFTIIRANRNGDQTITLTKPDDSFIGKALIIRKTNGNVGTFVTLKAGDGVAISPADSTPLRRVGSSATLVYTGEGNWDVFGELP